MATFNANTVRMEARLEELAHCVEERGVEILGVQEHRRVHTDHTIRYQRVGGCTFISASAWRNDAQAATGGVGLMVSPRARKALRSVHQHTDRILVCEFEGNPVTTVMSVYSPTNTTPDEVVEEFYNELGAAIQRVPAHNFLVILGDFNARLGPEDAPFTFHSETNRNGGHLSALLTEHGLLATNTLFRKRMGKRWTFQNRGSGMFCQLDYILVRRKWRSSVLNAESYSTFDSVGSDHRVVSVKLRLSLRVPKNISKPRPDWETFAKSPILQSSYTAEVRSRLQPLDGEPQTSYGQFLAANEEATKRWVPTKRRMRTFPVSTHPDVVQARAQMVEARRRYEKERTVENQGMLNKTKEQLFSTYDQVKGEMLMEKVEKVEAVHGERQYKESWKIINEMSGRRRPREGQLAGSSPGMRVTSWFNHFRDLLGAQPSVEGAEDDIPAILENLNIDDGPFTAKEYAKVKSTLKQGKSAGPDGITSEVIKNCDLDDIVREHCNRFLKDNIKPEIWSLSNIIPVPKSGDLSKTDNYRGISLTCIIAKMVNSMILNRIRDAIDPHLRENQNGFRRARSTVGQILALRRIIEEVKKNNLTAVLCFIDFKKAFDSIHRAVMVKILRAYGVPPNLLRAIESMYRDTRAKVVTPDGETEEFEIHAGVLQGDTLAPFLFVVALDYALRKAISGREQELGFEITPRRSTRHPAVTLTDLDYADDICLISDRVEKAQKLLSRVEEECAKVGLRLNSKKTEVITYNIPPGHPPLMTAEGNPLKEVSDFKYLGSWVNSTEQDIKVRKALAWRALNGMKSVWNSNLSRHIKVSFFQATVESVLLYGCESWTLKKTLRKSLDGCYTRMLRAVLNINWSERVDNEKLYGVLPLLSDKVASRRMQFAGHCHRHPELPAGKLVLWEPSRARGHRSRGHPTKTFVEVLAQDAGVESSAELARCMDEREDWKKRWRTRLRTT